MTDSAAWITRVWGALLVGACVCFTATVTHADDTHVVPAAQAWLAEDGTNYTGVLLAGYLSAPLLATGVALTVSGFDTGELSIAGAAIGFGSALFVPATIHWLSGERRLAARAFFGWPVAMLAGGLSLGLVTIVAVSVFDPFGGSADGGWGNGLIVAAGAAIGAGMAAIAWPIFDVLDTDARRRERRERLAPSLTFSIAPLLHGGVAGIVRGAL